MTKNEFELLRVCRSAELAYFMSEHTLEKPKFIQSWFKNKVKADRDEMSDNQIQTICSDWQLKQKTFYKKYRGFIDHFEKVIQNLQYLENKTDLERIDALFEQLNVVGLETCNGLSDSEFDRANLPPLNHAGLFVIDSNQKDAIDDKGNIKDQLTMELASIDAKRFYYIIDLIRLFGFDSTDRERFVAGELVQINVTSSATNEFNHKLVAYEHGREKDWREELASTHKK